MSAPEKPDIPGWFGLRRVMDWSKARWLGSLLSVVVFVLFVMAVTAAGWILLHAIFDLGLGTPRTGFGTGAVIVALLGAPFVIWRAVVAQRQADIAQEGHITDRINTAVQGLGAEKEVSAIGRPVTIWTGKPKTVVHLVENYDEFTPPPRSVERSRYHDITEVDPNYGDDVFDGLHVELTTWPEDRTVIEWQGKSLDVGEAEYIGPVGDWQVFTETVPNLEVRLGAIYALERIAQDSERDHVQIMEILCAYVRENSGREDLNLPIGEPTPYQWVHWASPNLQTSRLDVDAALTVVGRRSEARKQHERERGYRPEFEEVTLHAKVIRRADLTGADFFSAQMQGIMIGHMKLNGARFRLAQLQAATFISTEFKGTDFTNAKLDGAFIRGSEMDAETKFEGASLEGVALHRVDLTKVKQVAEHLEVTFGDGSVTLPEGCDRPTHWPKRELELQEFREAWREWLTLRECGEPPEESDD